MTDPTPLQERIAEAVRQALSDGEALQCTRVWEAWGYKTMTDEDFTDASDGPLVEEVAAAILPIVDGEVRKAKADAWDEGYGDCWTYHQSEGMKGTETNPHSEKEN